MQHWSLRTQHMQSAVVAIALLWGLCLQYPDTVTLTHPGASVARHLRGTRECEFLAHQACEQVCV